MTERDLKFALCPKCRRLPDIAEYHCDDNAGGIRKEFTIECCDVEFGPYRSMEDLAAAWNWKELKRD